ncbi:MAG TPA: hypothetical protein VIZ43_05320, partial [Trebonia sp.]
IVAVLGTAELNVAMLNFQARSAIERIAAHAADLAVTAVTAGTGGGGDAGPLPARRPAER